MTDATTRFERCFTAHHAAVAAYFLRRCPTREDAEDAATEVFAVAWRRLEELPAPPEDRLWLFGVARRVLANQQRADRRRGALTARLQAVFATQTPQWEPPAQMSDEVAAAMARLSPAEREALLLVAWEGLEPARAAGAAGCSPAAFRARLHRARRHVAAALTDTSIAHSAPIAGDSP
jgi:RNA polymerase sigma-70 factor (ECF subfamily)